MQQLAKELGWQSVESLVRLEGFKDDWEFAVHRGRHVKLSATLKENGIDTDATITTVRRVLIPEAWKVPKMNELCCACVALRECCKLAALHFQVHGSQSCIQHLSNGACFMPSLH